LFQGNYLLLFPEVQSSILSLQPSDFGFWILDFGFWIDEARVAKERQILEIITINKQTDLDVTSTRKMVSVPKYLKNSSCLEII
jgi:hypothetical protein